MVLVWSAHIWSTLISSAAALPVLWQVLRRAVDTHQEELHRLLRGRPDLRLIIETEDFPISNTQDK